MTDKKTTAIVMAGGRGERLRPITDTMPKPNLEVGGKPALGYALSMLSRAGIHEATVTVRYRYEDIKDLFGDEYDGVSLDYRIETEPLGTAGGVRAVVAEAGDTDEIVVLSGDSVCDFDLRPALSTHRAGSAEATMILYPSNEPWNYGCVRLERGGSRIVEFVEKPPYTQHKQRALVNTGIYILSPTVIDRIPDGNFDFGRDLFPAMIAEGHRVDGFVAEGYWCDIGSPESYRRACFDAAKNMIRGVTATLSPTGAIISADCRAGMGSTLTGCVLGRGVTVGVDVTARDSILCRGVTVGDGVVIGPGTVIGEDVFIPTGSIINAGELIPSFHS